MAKRIIDPKAIARDEDVWGNNAAFTCPICGSVFLVSAFFKKHKQGRPCPRCEKSRAFPPIKNKKTKRKSKAYIEWHCGPYTLQ